MKCLALALILALYAVDIKALSCDVLTDRCPVHSNFVSLFFAYQSFEFTFVVYNFIMIGEKYLSLLFYRKTLSVYY